MNKILIAYFSRADENYVDGQLKYLEKGNTQVVAEKIQSLTGGELFKIEAEKSYAKDYTTCVEQAHQDQVVNVFPKLKQTLKDISQYDEIYLGYPNYWSTMPMAVFTFLTSVDTSGKLIYPFCTHEGRGFGQSLKDLEKLCPQARITSGLSLYGSKVAQSDKEIEQWVQSKGE